MTQVTSVQRYQDLISQITAFFTTRWNTFPFTASIHPVGVQSSPILD